MLLAVSSLLETPNTWFARREHLDFLRMKKALSDLHMARRHLTSRGPQFRIDVQQPGSTGASSPKSPGPQSARSPQLKYRLGASQLNGEPQLPGAWQSKAPSSQGPRPSCSTVPGQVGSRPLWLRNSGLPTLKRPRRSLVAGRVVSLVPSAICEGQLRPGIQHTWHSGSAGSETGAAMGLCVCFLG